MRLTPVLLPLLVVFALLSAQDVRSQEAKPMPSTWQEAARSRGLSEESIAVLERNRVLVTNDAYKQIFSAYLSGKNPLFITSDSLLNAYHVLYEESVLRLENAMAAKLPPILRLILANLEGADDHLVGRADLVSAARRRAVLVVGIALRLVDESFRLDDEELNKIALLEVQRIEKAEWVGMPAWLGEPDHSFMALDYSRYMPRGFYTQSESLKRYFRAVSWLQSIPFRVSKDEELLAVLMLGSCLTSNRLDDQSKLRDVGLFFRAYASFIGSGDDWDIMTAASKTQTGLRMDLGAGGVEATRERLMEEARGYGRRPQISDQVRFAPGNPQEAAEPNFRIISAYRTPSAVLFQRTTDLRRFERSYPDGLEVAIALGSGFARKEFGDPRKEDLLKVIDSCGVFFQGGSLHIQYLNALRALVDEPERDAPDFMKGAPWEAKSCSTVLAGWAQMRHTWVLQAKQTLHYLGETMVPVGFVEPDPEFFSRMAELAARTRSLLDRAGVFEPNHEHAIRSIERVRALLDGVRDEESFRRRVSSLRSEDRMGLEMGLMMMETNRTTGDRGSAAYFEGRRKWLDTLAEDIREGRSDKHPRLEETLRRYEFDLDGLWRQLEEASRRLETIAHKQLRSADLNRSEIAFVKGYGRRIAGIMLYGGNSYLTPNDDAPRVVDVYANPAEHGYLHVGIARPRRMYVLYPWQGKTVLCEGGVLPYYEFVSDSRLTDESWKARLDADERPPIPRWASSVVVEGRLGKPNMKGHH